MTATKLQRNDYLRNKFAAEEMADSIRDYWHRKGYTQVRVWVEESSNTTEYGTKLPSSYSIRSNMKFDVAKIPNGMIE